MTRFDSLCEYLIFSPVRHSICSIKTSSAEDPQSYLMLRDFITIEQAEGRATRREKCDKRMMRGGLHEELRLNGRWLGGDESGKFDEMNSLRSGVSKTSAGPCNRFYQSRDTFLHDPASFYASHIVLTSYIIIKVNCDEGDLRLNHTRQAKPSPQQPKHRAEISSEQKAKTENPVESWNSLLLLHVMGGVTKGGRRGGGAFTQCPENPNITVIEENCGRRTEELMRIKSAKMKN